MSKWTTNRHHEILIDNETRFYVGLRCKQLVGDGPASMSYDEVICNDLRHKYTTENPEWVVAWDEREKLRQDHKKYMAKLEARVLKLKIQDEA